MISGMSSGNTPSLLNARCHSSVTFSLRRTSFDMYKTCSRNWQLWAIIKLVWKSMEFTIHGNPFRRTCKYQSLHNNVSKTMEVTLRECNNYTCLMANLTQFQRKQLRENKLHLRPLQVVHLHPINTFASLSRIFFICLTKGCTNLKSGGYYRHSCRDDMLYPCKKAKSTSTNMIVLTLTCPRGMKAVKMPQTNPFAVALEPKR